MYIITLVGPHKLRISLLFSNSIHILVELMSQKREVIAGKLTKRANIWK